MKVPVEYVDQTPSTNQHLSDLPPIPFEGCGKAVATFTQTQGRGQRGNTWLSEPGLNCHYSLLFAPQLLPAQNAFLISQLVALAVKSFLTEFTTDITIKWPNDIYWKHRKLGGILIENQLMGNYVERAIIGIGLNVNQTSFPDELPLAVSLTNITSLHYNLLDFTEKLHHVVCKELNDLNLEKNDDIQRYYINGLYRRDGYHAYEDKDGQFSAKIRGINALGHLMLELEDGSVRTYAFKEVAYCQ